MSLQNSKNNRISIDIGARCNIASISSAVNTSNVTNGVPGIRGLQGPAGHNGSLIVADCISATAGGPSIAVFAREPSFVSSDLSNFTSLYTQFSSTEISVPQGFYKVTYQFKLDTSSTSGMLSVYAEDIIGQIYNSSQIWSESQNALNQSVIGIFMLNVANSGDIIRFLCDNAYFQSGQILFEKY